MKWILIVLGSLVGLVLLAALVLFLLGFRSGAGKMSSSIEIERPPAEVWPWLVEPEKLKGWVSWLIDVRDLTPGVEGAGKRVVWVMDDPNMNEKIEMEAEYVAVDPPRSATVHISSKRGFEGTSTWRLVDLGGRTRFETEGAFEYHHAIARLFEPLVTPQARKKQKADMAKLKALVEASGK